jgi:hypothetical protein
MSQNLNHKKYTYRRCVECTTLNYEPKGRRSPSTRVCGYCGEGKFTRVRPKGAR